MKNTMKDSVLVKVIKQKKPVDGAKVKRLRAHRSKKVLVEVPYTGSYTGSPDSEVVANYIGGFHYRPERSAEIQEKYKKLVRSVSR